MAMLLILSGCGPGGGPPNIKDIGFDADGAVVLVDFAYEESGYDGENSEVATEQGQASEACLEDGACIRLIDDRRIEESSDGWATSETVWQINPNASWWDGEYGGGFPADVGVFDVVVLPDQSVLVAAGQIFTISRSADGQWSPTVADLRTLDKPVPLLALTLAALIVMAAGMSFGPEPRCGQRSVFFMTPMFAMILFQLQAPNALFPFVAAVLFYPPAICGAALLLGGLLRARRQAGFVRKAGLLLALAALSLVVVWAATYVLWSRDNLSWGLSGLISIVGFVVLGVGSAKALHSIDNSGYGAQLELGETAWSIKPWVATAVAFFAALSVLPLVVYFGLPSGLFVSSASGLSMGSLVAVLIGAFAVTRVRYDPSDV